MACGFESRQGVSVKRVVFFGALAIFGTALWAAVAYEHGFAHFLGIDTQGSQNYDFVSGVGPMIITALGYGGIISALVGKFNCHHHGCWRIGKHHVNGSPWCTVHHHEVRPERRDHEILESIEGSLGELLKLLKAQAGE